MVIDKIEQITNFCLVNLALPGINLADKLWLSLQSVTFQMDMNIINLVMERDMNFGMKYSCRF